MSVILGIIVVVMGFMLGGVVGSIILNYKKGTDYRKSSKGIDIAISHTTEYIEDFHTNNPDSIIITDINIKDSLCIDMENVVIIKTSDGFKDNIAYIN